MDWRMRRFEGPDLLSALLVKTWAVEDSNL